MPMARALASERLATFCSYASDTRAFYHRADGPTRRRRPEPIAIGRPLKSDVARVVIRAIGLTGGRCSRKVIDSVFTYRITMKNRFVAFTLVIFVCGGCRGPWGGLHTNSPHEQSTHGEATDGGSSRAVAGGELPPSRAPVTHLVFDVLYVAWPAGDVAAARKIWNHVDEMRAGSASVARLARNGVRVGAAGPDDWPAIRAILDAAGATARPEQLMSQTSLPVGIAMGQVEEAETVFAYDREGRLAGRTLEAGERLLQLDSAHHPELGGTTDIRVTFIVRHDTGRIKWEQQDGILQQVPDYVIHDFDSLGALLTLQPGEYLVAGPSGEFDNEYLVGARFFTDGQGNRASERLVIITPSPHRTAGVAGPVATFP